MEINVVLDNVWTLLMVYSHVDQTVLRNCVRFSFKGPIRDFWVSPQQVCGVFKEINIIFEYNDGSRFREEAALAVGSVSSAWNM